MSLIHGTIVCSYANQSSCFLTNDHRFNYRTTVELVENGYYDFVNWYVKKE